MKKDRIITKYDQLLQAMGHNKNNLLNGQYDDFESELVGAVDVIGRIQDDLSVFVTIDKLEKENAELRAKLEQANAQLEEFQGEE